MSDEVLGFVKERGITEVVHFTTNRGLVGILYAGQLQCRDELAENDYLENIRFFNCSTRKDPEWTGYVNMSISVVNGWMFGTSKRWHDTKDVWWAVLSFAPDILADDGVVFTTTNNIYTDAVRRGQGLAGLQDLYREPIEWGYRGSVKWRSPGLPADRPTDDQAEVLYPGAVSLSRLRAIYVRREEHLDAVAGLRAVLPNARDVSVSCRPEVFQ